MTAIAPHRPVARPSALLARAWKDARDLAYAAGNGPEFDRLTDEIESLRARHPERLEDLWALVRDRCSLLPAPPSTTAS